MAHQTVSFSEYLAASAKDWRRLSRLILPFAVVYGALLFVENIAISRIDLWLPVESFEVAAQYSIYVSAVMLWLQLCVIGAGISYVFKRYDDGAPIRPDFLGLWCLVCLLLALSLMVIDLWAFGIQFSDEPMDGTTIRWLLLATLYGRILAYYVAARFLFGATRPVRTGTSRWATAWTATTVLQSIGLFVALLALKLFINGVIIDLIGFTPVIAPLWFVQDELNPLRDIVGQGIQIAAETLGVFLIVGFWTAVEWLVGRDHTDGAVQD